MTPIDEHGGAEAPAGLLGSLRALLATLIALGHNRLELFSVEVQEEIERAASLLLWSVATLLLGFVAVLLLSAAVVLSVAQPYRWLAAGLLGVLFLIACTAAGVTARARLTLKPRPFDATLSELAKDHERLKH